MTMLGTGAGEADLSLAEMIAAHRPGYSLARRFYSDPVIFEREMERFAMRHWHCAGHVSLVAEPGDFFTVEIGSESAILVRGQDGELRALLNVCRHRGSRVCTEREGKARGQTFTCPYHAWTYGLDGALRAARQMPEGFDRSAHGLKTLPVKVIEGLIFIAFTDAPLGLSHVAETLAGSARFYGWGDAKVAYRETWPINANWKLAFENYLECYHCAPAHQEFARLHADALPWEQACEINQKLRERENSLGFSIHNIDRWAEKAAPGEEVAEIWHFALQEGCVSGSNDGLGVAPLMGAFTEYDGAFTYFGAGPTSAFLAYPDCGLIYRFMPRTVDFTEMEVIWLVRGDAKEGADYDLERLTWLWKITSIADKRIIELNQKGVNSNYYEPGPYTPMESGTSRFVELYLREIG